MKRLHKAFLLTLLTAFGGWGPAVAQIESGDTPAEAVYSQAELDQMLAPIALYPDVLLSQVLMAATYPLEVVEASRWTQANPTLEGDAAVQAVADEDWDNSVKALVGFPDLIQLMDENLSWTRRLGDAFLLQEEAVMETVQRLRKKASAEGSLAKMDHVTVEREATHIAIEPSNVEVVYVPYYSTRVVYGDWWWHDYPPVYWDYGPSYSSHIGFHWSRGFRVSTDFYFSTCYWPRRSVVVIDRNHHRHYDRYDFKRMQAQHRYDRYTTHWRHDPYHRRGVRYMHDSLYDRYGNRRFADRDRYRKPHERRPISTLRPDRVQQRSFRERPDSVTWKRPSVHSGRPDTRPDRGDYRRERPDARPNRPDFRGDRQRDDRRRPDIQRDQRDRPSVVTKPPSRTKPPTTRPDRPDRRPPPPRVNTPPPRKSEPTYAANPRYTEGNRRATEIRRDRLSRSSEIRRHPRHPKDP